jgi:DNA replication protein DnaC
LKRGFEQEGGLIVLASIEEWAETVKEFLERQNRGDLVPRYQAALEESDAEVRRRCWVKDQVNRIARFELPIEDVPDAAAWRTYTKSVVTNRLRLAGVPPDFVSMTWTDVKPQPGVKGFDGAVKTCRAFSENITEHLDNGDSLVLCGTVGVGKSLLATLICRGAREGGRTVLFARTRALLDRLKDWDNAFDFREELEAADLLVLDDLGAEYASDWTRAEVDALVSARHADRRSLIVTTNLSPVDLAKLYSPRVLDRLRERGPALEIRGPSYRRGGAERGEGAQ